MSRIRHAVLIAVAVIGLLVLLAIRLSISIAGHETPAWWEIPIIIAVTIGFWAAGHRFIGPILDRVFHWHHQSGPQPTPASADDTPYPDDIT
jgi:hypothetical protein